MSRVATKAVPLIQQIPDKKIRSVITNCLRSMKEWGLEVKGEIRWSMKKMDSFGVTTNVSGEQFIRIVLNQGLATQSKKVIEDTVYHELAHAVVGIKKGHGDAWKKVINTIRSHTGLPLQVNGEIGDVTNDFWFTGYKYVLRCEKCGQMIGFNTKNELVKNPGEWDEQHNCRRFSHTACGGAWVRVK